MEKSGFVKIKAGAGRNKQFTWKKTAEEVIKVYRKLAGGY